jgi:hypothetical protein
VVAGPQGLLPERQTDRAIFSDLAVVLEKQGRAKNKSIIISRDYLSLPVGVGKK